MSKETFKAFVKNNPSLIKHINNNSMTWQKFYEMYELYGGSSTVWDEYLDTGLRNSSNNLGSTEGAFKELMSVVKSIDLEKVQRGINSIQKTISMVQDLGIGNTDVNQYERKPIYRRFED